MSPVMKVNKSAEYFNAFSLNAATTSGINYFHKTAEGLTTTAADGYGAIQKLVIQSLHPGTITLRLYGNFGLSGVAGSPIAAFTSIPLVRAVSNTNASFGSFVFEDLDIYGIDLTTAVTASVYFQAYGFR